MLGQDSYYAMAEILLDCDVVTEICSSPLIRSLCWFPVIAAAATPVPGTTARRQSTPIRASRRPRHDRADSAGPYGVSVVSRIFHTFVWRWPDPGSCHAGPGRIEIPQQIHLQITLHSPSSTGNMSQPGSRQHQRRLAHESRPGPRVNTPPAKAGGFGLRLKAGSTGHPADQPPPPQGEGWFDQHDTGRD